MSGRRVALAVVLSACAGQQTDGPHRGESANGVEGRHSAQPFRPGIRFDAGTIRPGARVGELVLDSIAARRATIDSVFVGVAHFRGEIELTGATIQHPDPDARPLCFEADSASAARLPRWEGDERRAWFCFENQAGAIRAIGPSSDGVAAAIVIDRLTIHRGFSDQVNSARLIRGAAAGAGAPQR